MFHGAPEAPGASRSFPAGTMPDAGPDSSTESKPVELAVLELAVILGCPGCISIQAEKLTAGGTTRAEFCAALQKSIDAAGQLAMMCAAQAMDRFDELTG